MVYCIVQFSPTAFESAPRTEPQLAAHVINAKQDWEVRKIIGKEDIDGVLPPEHSLGHVKELVDKFEARLQAQREANNGQRGTRRCIGWLIAEAGRPGNNVHHPLSHPISTTHMLLIIYVQYVSKNCFNRNEAEGLDTEDRGI
jgi:hypothetical protein